MEKKTVFLREATGFVRELGTLDSFWINISVFGILFSTFFVSVTAPDVGGDALIGAVLPLAGFFLVGIVFSYVGSNFPRVAADYVFTSRKLSPSIGFVGNAGFFLSAVPIFMGLSAVVVQSIGIVPLLEVLGYYYKNSSLISIAITLSSTNGILTLGTLEIIIAGVLAMLGTRVFRTIQRVIIPLAFLAATIMIAVEIAIPTSTAVSNLNSFASTVGGVSNLSQNVTLSTAASVPAYHDFGNTLALNAVYNVAFTFTIGSIYIAGEMKSVKKSMFFSILGAVGFGGLIMSLATFFQYQQWGYSFISKFTYLSVFVGAYPTLPTPYISVLEAVASGSVLIAILILVFTTLQLWSYIVSASFIGSRLLFSYSMDRILPSFVGDVSDKYHSPIKAIIITIIAGLAGLLLFTLPFSSGFAFSLTAIGTSIIILFPEMVLCIAVMKTAWREEKKYATIALISIAYLAFTFYQYLTNPILVASPTFSYSLLAGEIILLFAIYFISKYVRKRQGIEWDLIFKNIPPE